MEFELQWIISLPWKWSIVWQMDRGYMGHGHREMSGPEDGNVVIVNQHPASVADWYVGHWSQ